MNKFKGKIIFIKTKRYGGKNAGNISSMNLKAKEPAFLSPVAMLYREQISYKKTFCAGALRTERLNRNRYGNVFLSYITVFIYAVSCSETFQVLL